VFSSRSCDDAKAKNDKTVIFKDGKYSSSEAEPAWNELHEYKEKDGAT
jgi:hypothetical protein